MNYNQLKRYVERRGFELRRAGIPGSPGLRYDLYYVGLLRCRVGIFSSMRLVRNLVDNMSGPTIHDSELDLARGLSQFGLTLRIESEYEDRGSLIYKVFNNYGCKFIVYNTNHILGTLKPLETITTTPQQNYISIVPTPSRYEFNPDWSLDRIFLSRRSRNHRVEGTTNKSLEKEFFGREE